MNVLFVALKSLVVRYDMLRVYAVCMPATSLSRQIELAGLINRAKFCIQIA
jgi:hypothetical protein